MIPLLPFALELPLDAWLIKRGKKDLSWKTRTALIALSCLACWLLEGSQFNIEGLRVIGSSVCLALAPYAWFDLSLNLMRRKPWYYVSSTNGKWWDSKLAGMNHWVVLTLRVIGFGLCIFGWIMI